MIPSNVTGGFWLVKIVQVEERVFKYCCHTLGMVSAKDFCKLYLSERDAKIVLVDKNGEEFYVKYLPERRGLSGGWKGFSIAHKLLEGDVLVFQLVRNYKLKVYIVRANSLDEVDGALGLLLLDSQTQQRNFGIQTKSKKIGHVQRNVKNPKRAGGKHFKPSPSNDLMKHDQKNSPTAAMSQPSAINECLGIVMEDI